MNENVALPASGSYNLKFYLENAIRNLAHMICCLPNYTPHKSLVDTGQQKFALDYSKSQAKWKSFIFKIEKTKTELDKAENLHIN